MMHGFDADSLDIYLQEDLDLHELYNKWKEKTKYQLEHIKEFKEEGYKVPPISHGLYITSMTNPTGTDASLYYQSVQRLSAIDNNFKHYYWVNNKSLIGSLDIAEVRDLGEFTSHPLYPILMKLTDQGKYIIASDIARVMIVQKYGGIYQDNDAQIYDAGSFIELMKSFDSILGRDGEKNSSTIGNAIFASKPNHPIINEYARIIQRNCNLDPDVPDYIRFPKHEFFKILATTGPVALTMAYYRIAPLDSNNDILLPKNVIFNERYAQDGANGALPSFDFEGLHLHTIAADMFELKWARAGETSLEGPYALREYGYQDELILNLTFNKNLLNEEFLRSTRYGDRDIDLIYKLLPRVDNLTILTTTSKKLLDSSEKFKEKEEILAALQEAEQNLRESHLLSKHSVNDTNAMLCSSDSSEIFLAGELVD